MLLLHGRVYGTTHMPLHVSKSGAHPDEDGEEENEKEEEGGGGKRKAKGEAKGSNKKKGKRGRTAAVAKDEGEGGSSGVLDEAAMMRQIRMMSPEDREEFFNKVNKSKDI